MKKTIELLIHTKHFILFVFSCLFDAVSALFLSWSYSMLLGMTETSETAVYTKMGILAFSYIVIPSVLMKLGAIIQIPFDQNFSSTIRKKMIDNIFSKDYETFVSKDRSTYISLLINDVKTFEEQFMPAFKTVTESSLIIILVITVLAFTNYPIFLFVLISSAFILCISIYFKRRMINLNQKISKQSKVYTNKLENLLRGRDVIRMNDASISFGKQINIESKNLERLRSLHHFYELFQDHVLAQLGTIMSLLTLLFVASKIAMNEMDLSRATFLVLLMNIITQNLVKIAPGYNTMISASLYVENTLTADLLDHENYHGKTECGTKKFSFTSKIDVKKLVFRYNDKAIINGFDTQISKGDKVLLTGPSGCGKSTLLSLLSGEYASYEGDILYDETELKEFDREDLYNKTAIIYQDVFVFEDTVRNNITLYHDYSDEQIKQAVIGAGLEMVIQKLPNGLDTVLIENGTELSGGERQRLSIARALIKNPQIIFADEPTANLSADISNEIERSILGLPHTVVYISHKEMKENSSLITKQLSF